MTKDNNRVKHVYCCCLHKIHNYDNILTQSKSTNIRNLTNGFIKCKSYFVDPRRCFEGKAPAESTGLMPCDLNSEKEIQVLRFSR